MILDNLNFCDIAKATTGQDWDRVAEVLVASAKRLEAGGATAILIGAISMHRVHDRVADAVKVPVLHIAERCRTEDEGRWCGVWRRDRHSLT